MPKTERPGGGHPGRVVGGRLGGVRLGRLESQRGRCLAFSIGVIGAEFFRVMSPIVSFVSPEVILVRRNRPGSRPQYRLNLLK